MNTQCPLIVSELFGMRHFAENFALVAMVSATGSSFVFATALFGTIYDYAAEAQAIDAGQILSIVSPSSAEEKVRECFGTGAALVSAGCCAAAIMLSLMLMQRQQRRRGAKVVTIATATA